MAAEVVDIGLARYSARKDCDLPATMRSASGSGKSFMSRAICLLRRPVWCFKMRGIFQPPPILTVPERRRHDAALAAVAIRKQAPGFRPLACFGGFAHCNDVGMAVRYYSITFDSSQSTASSSWTRRTNRFSPLREYTSACVPVSGESAAPKSKTRMPFAGLAETDFASNCPASAAKATAAADELESKRPSKYHMSGVGFRKTPISSPLHWTTRSALTSPTREF